MDDWLFLLINSSSRRFIQFIVSARNVTMTVKYSFQPKKKKKKNWKLRRNVKFIS